MGKSIAGIVLLAVGAALMAMPGCIRAHHDDDHYRHDDAQRMYNHNDDVHRQDMQHNDGYRNDHPDYDHH